MATAKKSLLAFALLALAVFLAWLFGFGPSAEALMLDEFPVPRPDAMQAGERAIPGHVD